MTDHPSNDDESWRQPDYIINNNNTNGSGSSSASHLQQPPWGGYNEYWPSLAMTATDARLSLPPQAADYYAPFPQEHSFEYVNSQSQPLVQASYQGQLPYQAPEPYQQYGAYNAFGESPGDLSRSSSSSIPESPQLQPWLVNPNNAHSQFVGNSASPQNYLSQDAYHTGDYYLPISQPPPQQFAITSPYQEYIPVPAIENSYSKAAEVMSVVPIHHHNHSMMSQSLPVRPRQQNRIVMSKKSKASGKTIVRRNAPSIPPLKKKVEIGKITGACWRCKRYRKACDDAAVCNSCLTAGFRIWPSEFGCCRGNLEDLASPIMPKNAEKVFAGLSFDQPKRSNWRVVRMLVPSADFSTGDDMQQLLWTVLGTRMFGVEFVELFDIIIKYQNSRETKHPLIEAACLHLSATSNLYHTFITTDVWFPSPDIQKTLKTFRTCSARFWRVYLTSSLSGLRSEWFPLFLASILTLCSVVVWSDAVFAMPESLQRSLWRELSETVLALRAQLYKAGLNLLHILTRGSKPWKMTCWTKTEHVREDGVTVTVRNEEGMKLLGYDVGAFDGVMALRVWLDKYEETIERDGKIWFSHDPFTTADVLPMAVISRFIS